MHSFRLDFGSSAYKGGVGSGSRRPNTGAGASASGTSSRWWSRSNDGGGNHGISQAASIRDYPMTAPIDPDLCPFQEHKQRRIKEMLGNMKQKVGQTYSKFSFFHSIAANATTKSLLQNLINQAAKVEPSIKASTACEVMGKYQNHENKLIDDYIGVLKKKWLEYGVTIMSDGWTSPTRQTIINFTVHCDAVTVFLKSVEASNVIKDYKYIRGLLMDVIVEVDKENVVQIGIDNDNNFNKARGKLMEKYILFWTHCVSHCINLMLKDIRKIYVVKRIV